MRALVPWCVFVVLLVSCASEPEAPPELRQAVGVLVRMTSPMELQNSMFYAVFPDGTPKQYVSFLFSDLGAAEWPPMEEMGEGMPGMELPRDVFITHSKPDTGRQVQVVIRWDDARRIILFDGYVDPSGPPVLQKETDLPIVRPSDLARIAAQSNLETGARAQSF